MRVDIVNHGTKRVGKELRGGYKEEIVKHAAGLVLRENVEMKFKKNKLFGHDNVIVSEVFLLVIINYCS